MSELINSDEREFVRTISKEYVGLGFYSSSQLH
jgi:hypothetical protein